MISTVILIFSSKHAFSFAWFRCGHLKRNHSKLIWHYWKHHFRKKTDLVVSIRSEHHTRNKNKVLARLLSIACGIWWIRKKANSEEKQWEVFILRDVLGSRDVQKIKTSHLPTVTLWNVMECVYVLCMLQTNTNKQVTFWLNINEINTKPVRNKDENGKEKKSNLLPNVKNL